VQLLGARGRADGCGAALGWVQGSGHGHPLALPKAARAATSCSRGRQASSACSFWARGAAETVAGRLGSPQTDAGRLWSACRVGTEGALTGEQCRGHATRIRSRGQNVLALPSAAGAAGTPTARAASGRAGPLDGCGSAQGACRVAAPASARAAQSCWRGHPLLARPARQSRVQLLGARGHSTDAGRLWSACRVGTEGADPRAGSRPRHAHPLARPKAARAATRCWRGRHTNRACSFWERSAAETVAGRLGSPQTDAGRLWSACRVGTEGALTGEQGCGHATRIRSRCRKLHAQPHAAGAAGTPTARAASGRVGPLRQTNPGAAQADGGGRAAQADGGGRAAQADGGGRAAQADG
jgi:hypothetical protein